MNKPTNANDAIHTPFSMDNLIVWYDTDIGTIGDYLLECPHYKEEYCNYYETDIPKSVPSWRLICSDCEKVYD
jgi:hypothetical protein